MRINSRLTTSSVGLLRASFIALPLALAFSGSAVASDYECDGFIGNFDVRPEHKGDLNLQPDGNGRFILPRENEVVLKVVKDDAGFAVVLGDSASGEWERRPLQVGLPEDKEKEMLAQGGRLPHKLTCALWGEDLLLWQFSAGSADNPSESEDRDRRKYPQKTPYVMIYQAGIYAGHAGLYRLTAQD